MIIAIVVVISLLYLGKRKWSTSEAIEYIDSPKEDKPDPQPEDTLTVDKIQDLVEKVDPVSVNYHLTRRCNFVCKHCFHTNTSGARLSLEEATKGLNLLKASGTKRSTSQEENQYLLITESLWESSSSTLKTYASSRVFL